MTNGANYTRGKLHHSPWHSDIRTSNQLNRLELRGWLRANQDGVWKVIRWIRRNKRCGSRTGVVPNDECRVGKGSGDGAGGGRKKIEESNARPRSTGRDTGAPVQRRIPSMLCSAGRGGRKRVKNEIETLIMKVKEGIEGRPSKRRNTNRKGDMEH